MALKTQRFSTASILIFATFPVFKLCDFSRAIQFEWDKALDEVTELDLKRLQGKWEQVYLEADGMVNPPDNHTALGAVTVIENDTFQVGTPSGSTLLAGTFTLDATTNPKSITWIDSIGKDAGKHLPSIYRLDDDNFTFFAADEGAPRPTEFATTLGLTMRQFVRVR